MAPERVRRYELWRPVKVRAHKHADGPDGRRAGERASVHRKCSRGAQK